MMHHLHPLNLGVLAMNQGTHRLRVEDMFDSETSHFMGAHLPAMNMFEPSPYNSFPLSGVFEESLLSSNDIVSSTLLSPLDYQPLYDLSPIYSKHKETIFPLDPEVAHYSSSFHREFFPIGQEQQHQQQELETIKIATSHSGTQSMVSLAKDAMSMNPSWFPNHGHNPNSGMPTTKKDMKRMTHATMPITQKKDKCKQIKIIKNRPNVKKACANCQKSHVACDVERPCRRCVFQGRAETCVDSEQKQKGRRRADMSPPKSLLEHSGRIPNAGFLRENGNVCP
jgi:hypothetical protein